MRSKAKKPVTKRKDGDKQKAQSARFIETAREVEADESGKMLDEVFSKIVPVKRT